MKFIPWLIIPWSCNSCPEYLSDIINSSFVKYGFNSSRMYPATCNLDNVNNVEVIRSCSEYTKFVIIVLFASEFDYSCKDGLVIIRPILFDAELSVPLFATIVNV